jgi:hypothetical protein
MYLMDKYSLMSINTQLMYNSNFQSDRHLRKLVVKRIHAVVVALHELYRAYGCLPVCNKNQVSFSMISQWDDEQGPTKTAECRICKGTYYLFITYRFANQKATIDFSGYIIHRILSHDPFEAEELEDAENLRNLDAIFTQFVQ